MNLLTKILAIYMLALSFIPCGDGGSGIIELANHLFEVEHQHTSDHDQHSNSCSDDSCSPFCVCSCCSNPVSHPTNINLASNHMPLISRDILPYHSDFYPSSFSSSIWQPPKFS